MNHGSGRGRWVLLLLGLALVTWATAAPTWVSAGGSSVLTGTVLVRVPGARAAPGMVGAALALAAAGAALALAGRVGRWVVVAVTVACGGLIAWSAVGLLADPVPAARQAVATATGVDHVIAPVRTTAAPWSALGVAVLVVGCGVLLARASSRWAGPSSRHERPVGAPEARLDTSVDAAAVTTEGPVVAEPGAAGPEPSPPTEHRRTVPRKDGDGAEPGGGEAPDERAAWDALSRGEDPT